jgi:hypothetical protein
MTEVEEVVQQPTYEFDMDNPPVIKHFWVDRGLVMSCEGAGHPNHRVFKRK